ncbi:phosphoenolpyruvate-dependent sugar phosphotransferase system eiia 2 [Lucifera butyrica]|uniref:Phosphoenolpyruvate-dependent sugar phosphotransferase system eiia 2 n=1 Tax=Lucifera butyrica TaxID=1351585 RepID=A0A498RFT8_9FIRM|nr:PTS sugar transporter subunit IIA [Lucifera butyrica]VBB08942.1 phosphoenolpyruvate-dependent sugar phosphotransferase system eiia 2 [Lucifera butyrica]
MSEISFDETLILIDLQVDSYAEVLKFMAANLHDKGFVKESYAAAVIAREQKFATGLPTEGCGVAIPHTDIEHVAKAAICFGILKKEVPFGIMGEETATVPVKLVFMLAMNTAHTQLELLQKLTQIFQERETLNCLANEKSKAKIKDIISRKLNLAG